MMRIMHVSVMFVLFFGFSNFCNAQDNPKHTKNDKEMNSTVGNSGEREEEINENYEIIGTNLRNADGTEMGPFALNRTKVNTKTKSTMPEEGFNSEDYAKDMKTGKYPKSVEQADDLRRCKLSKKSAGEKKVIF